jgi:hypothetical protein
MKKDKRKKLSKRRPKVLKEGKFEGMKRTNSKPNKRDQKSSDRALVIKLPFEEALKVALTKKKSSKEK